MDRKIVIKGAREHNLKNISLEIPRNRFVVITGLSGSGKSSLAFDTIYAEGQRRYLESLSAYARQFLEQMSKPQIDSIEGLSPTVSIEQKNISKNPRSTVGTVTEIYDFLRLLYARAGQATCPNCGKEIRSQSTSQIVDQILAGPQGSRFVVLAPIARGKKGEFQQELAELRERGFVRAKIDGMEIDISSPLKLQKTKKHDISIYIDRLILREGISMRLSDSVEIATGLTNGLVEVEYFEPPSKRMFSTRFACVDCGISFPEIEPRFFSFNSPHGACEHCNGIGQVMKIDTKKLSGQSDRSFSEADIHELEKDLKENTTVTEALAEILEYVSRETCPVCQGSRLRKEASCVYIGGKNIHQVCEQDIQTCGRFFETLDLGGQQRLITEPILKEIKPRLRFIQDVGLGYLTLSRPIATLSGGEAQRIRLATQIGSNLIGVLYVLDEPSIGLHQRDNAKLLSALEGLRDKGNSVLVVEHDEETIRRADYVIDLGPGAGEHGGQLIYAGSSKDLLKKTKSITADFMSGRDSISTPTQRRRPDPNRMLSLLGAKKNNLQNIDTHFPLGCFICVTGVSGSGKSSLVLDTLLPLLEKHTLGHSFAADLLDGVTGLEQVDKVIHVNQAPIGRTPRSNPATYTGVFSLIRDLFAELSDSKVRGYTASRFSFNVSGGRCEACSGDGTLRISMNFLPDVYVPCEVCEGARYNRETLEIHYKEKNISDVLNMSIDQACAFFDRIPAIKTKLETLTSVGLGYLRLGQNAVTLSGGEAQRIKLAKELSRRATGRTIYILDEPTTGLHFEDIRKLLGVLHQLVDRGNTVIVIEHNLDVIKQADFVIDLGPEGGGQGGQIVCQGTPESIAECPASYTGQFLAKVL